MRTLVFLSLLAFGHCASAQALRNYVDPSTERGGAANLLERDKLSKVRAHKSSESAHIADLDCAALAGDTVTLTHPALKEVVVTMRSRTDTPTGFLRTGIGPDGELVAFWVEGDTCGLHAVLRGRQSFVASPIEGAAKRGRVLVVKLKPAVRPDVQTFDRE